MKKIDSLLEQIEVFEKLAVYGDKSSFLKALGQGADVSNAPFPPQGLAQSLAALAGRLNRLASAWEKADAQSKNDADALRTYARAFEAASFAQTYTSREELNGKIGDLRRFRDNTLPLLRKVTPALAGEVSPIQEELGRIESFVNGFMRNTLGLSYTGEPSATPVPTDAATQTPAPAKPKSQVLMSTVARNLSTAMSDYARNTFMPLKELGEEDPKRVAAAKKIESMAAQLKRLHDQIRVKKNKSLDDRFALIAIASAFQETYGMMEFADLQKAPTFDMGRSSAFQQE
jgi:hypothetical protein